MALMILRIPKTKEPSMTWKYPLPLIAKKGTINAIGWKIMANVFWDHKDVFTVDSLDFGNSATIECHYSTLDAL